MDSVRYIIALGLLIGIPTAICFWLLVHPFIHFWKKVGPVVSYAAVGTLLSINVAILLAYRKLLLAIDYGTNTHLIVFGFCCLAVASVMLVKLKRQLTLTVQLGFPEIAPEKNGGKLLREGVYSKLRHPRYVEMVIGMLGYACIANYLASYILLVLLLPGLYTVVRLEEKELRDRFGEAYEDYCREVPRFFPYRKGRKEKP